MKLTFIRIPLHKLNYVSQIDEIKFDEDFIVQFRREYEPEERKEIFQQLDWAVKNPGFDLTSLVTNNRFKNEEIYKYVEKLHRVMIEEKLV